MGIALNADWPLNEYQQVCYSALDATVGSAVGWEQPTSVRSLKVAVVIGAQCYSNTTFRDLKYTGEDALEVAKRLRGENYAVDLLVGQVSETAVHDAMVQANARLAAGGTLVVYYAGHSRVRRGADGYGLDLVLRDSDAPTTVFMVDELASLAHEVDAGHRVFILDTCNAAVGAGATAPAAYLDPKDLWLLAADVGQDAQEARSARHGWYTQAFLHAFDTVAADLDRDGVVGFLEAHQAAGRDVREKSRGVQVPRAFMRVPSNPPLGAPVGLPSRALAWIPEDVRDLRLVWYGPGGARQDTTSLGLVPLDYYGSLRLEIVALEPEGLPAVRISKITAGLESILDTTPEIAAARARLFSRTANARFDVGLTVVTTGGADVSAGAPAMTVTASWDAPHDGPLQPIVRATARYQRGDIGNLSDVIVWMPEIDVGVECERFLRSAAGARVIRVGPVVGAGAALRGIVLVEEPDARRWTPLAFVAAGTDIGIGVGARPGRSARNWLTVSPRLFVVPTVEGVEYAGGVSATIGVSSR
jgi:hypothetical protein